MRKTEQVSELGLNFSSKNVLKWGQNEHGDKNDPFHASAEDENLGGPSASGYKPA